MPARVPHSAWLCITIDIGGFCPSIAPGIGTPSLGGFLSSEVLEILEGASRAHEVSGIDQVKIAPDFGHSGSAAVFAAPVLLDLPSFVSHRKYPR